jgi:hypothetical protein
VRPAPRLPHLQRLNPSAARHRGHRGFDRHAAADHRAVHAADRARLRRDRRAGRR